MSASFIVLFSCLTLAVVAHASTSYLASGVGQPISSGVGLAGSPVGTTSTIGVRPVPAPSVVNAPVGHHGRRPVIGLPAPAQSGAAYRRSSPVHQGTQSRRPVVIGHPAPIQSGIPSRNTVIGQSASVQHASLTRRPVGNPSAQVLPGSVHNRHCRDAQRCSNVPSVVYATDGKSCYKFSNQCQLAQANCQRHHALKPISRPECQRLPRISAPY